MHSYHIILADDHVALRRHVKGILSGVADLEIVGEVGDGIELLELLNELKLAPDMVILDISMPRLQGIEAARAIKLTRPDIKVLILTVHEDKEYLRQAISSGAEGYLLKENADSELFPAIETVRHGGIYVSPFFGRTGMP